MAAMTPTTMMTARNSGAGSRRPSVPPTWPPTIEPDRQESRRVPRHMGEGDEQEPGHAVDEKGEHVLGGVEPLEVVAQEDAEQRQQDDALGGAEVPPVHPGQEHRPEQDGTAVGRAGRLAVPSAPTDRGWSATNTQAIRMSTGTT